MPAVWPVLPRNQDRLDPTSCAVQVMAFGQIGQKATELNQPMRAGSELPSSETLPNQFTSGANTINPPNIRESACAILLHCGGAGGVCWRAPAARYKALGGMPPWCPCRTVQGMGEPGSMICSMV